MLTIYFLLPKYIYWTAGLSQNMCGNDLLGGVLRSMSASLVLSAIFIRRYVSLLPSAGSYWQTQLINPVI